MAHTVQCSVCTLYHIQGHIETDIGIYRHRELYPAMSRLGISPAAATAAGPFPRSGCSRTPGQGLQQRCPQPSCAPTFATLVPPLEKGHEVPKPGVPNPPPGPVWGGGLTASPTPQGPLEGVGGVPSFADLFSAAFQQLCGLFCCFSLTFLAWFVGFGRGLGWICLVWVWGWFFWCVVVFFLVDGVGFF